MSLTDIDLEDILQHRVGLPGQVRGLSISALLQDGVPSFQLYDLVRAIGDKAIELAQRHAARPSGEIGYPSSPGHKGDLETGKAAASDAARTAEVLRNRCLAVLVTSHCTADELAERLDESPLSIRPRLSELRKAGRIEPCEARRKNRSGKYAAVWRLTYATAS